MPPEIKVPGLTVANCFWWYAMHAETDITISPTTHVSIRWTQDSRTSTPTLPT